MEIPTQCVRVPVCLENLSSHSPILKSWEPVPLFPMAVVLAVWLITSYITKLILVVLFHLLAPPGCCTRTGVVPEILSGHHMVLKAISHHAFLSLNRARGVSLMEELPVEEPKEGSSSGVHFAMVK